jgi:WD40 repeat protein
MSLTKSFPISKRHYAHPEGNNCISSSQNYILSAGHDGIIRAFTPSPLSLAHEELYKWKSGDAIKSFVADDNLIAFIAEDQLILKYFIHGESFIPALQQQDTLLFEGVGGTGDVLVLSPNSSFIAFKHSTSGIRVIRHSQQPSNNNDNHVWGYKFDTDVIILGLAFDPTNSHVCALGHKGELTIFRIPDASDTNQLREVCTLSLPLIRTTGQRPRTVKMYWQGDCIIVPAYQGKYKQHQRAFTPLVDVFVVKRRGMTEWGLEGAPIKGHTDVMIVDIYHHLDSD